MSKFGMQMPASRKRSASPDVFTALAVIATVFLAVGLMVIYTNGAKVGKGGEPWSLQEAGNIQLPKPAER
ncbi:MAG: hypothetical protein KF864_11835 [Phycisphaeraceae bacterium]|nr:hypothetical protein [Phycisphaeraceae bacterium]